MKKVILLLLLLGTAGKYFQFPNTRGNTLTAMGTFQSVRNAYAKDPNPQPSDDYYDRTIVYIIVLWVLGVAGGFSPMPQDGKFHESLELSKLD